MNLIEDFKYTGLNFNNLAWIIVSILAWLLVLICWIFVSFSYQSPEEIIQELGLAEYFLQVE